MNASNHNLRATRSLTILCSVGFLLVASISTGFAAGSTATPKSTAKTTATPKATSKVTPKATIKPSAAPKINLPATGASGQRGVGRFGNITTAQRACLAGQGVKLPTGPAGGVRPSGTPTPGATPRTFGGGARGTFNSPKTTAAFKKCGIVLPTFSGGAGFNPNDPKLLAFQKCMTAAGFKPTNGFGRYDQADPDTAVALIKCQKSSGFTLPQRG